MIELLSAGRAPDSIVSDFHAPTRQDVLEKAVDEVFGTERDTTHLSAAVIAIAETDHTVVEGFQTAVGNGDAKDVAAEIVEDLFPTAGVLAVNNPNFLPD